MLFPMLAILIEFHAFSFLQEVAVAMHTVLHGSGLGAHLAAKRVAILRYCKRAKVCPLKFLLTLRCVSRQELVMKWEDSDGQEKAF